MSDWIKSLKAGLRSKKTTTLGVLAALSLILSVLTAWLDDDPATVPDWGAAFTAIGAIFLALQALFSRDASTSTEDSLKPKV